MGLCLYFEGEAFPLKDYGFYDFVIGLWNLVLYCKWHSFMLDMFDYGIGKCNSKNIIPSGWFY